MSASLRSRLTLLLLSVLLPGLAAAVWVIASTWQAEQEALSTAAAVESIRQAAPRQDEPQSVIDHHERPSERAVGATLRVAIGSLVLLGLALGGVAWVATRRIVNPSESSVETRPDAPSADGESEAGASDRERIEALGRLTGGVVHDFNNLLGVISNSAHLIQRQAPGPELQAPVAATLRAVEAGSRLTQHLMRFASRHPSAPHAVDLSSTLAEADEFLKSMAGRRIELSVAVAPATRPVMVDASALELALTTLTLNARDAMPAGGRLRLHACNAMAEDIDGLPAGDYVLITVDDEGTAAAQGPVPASGLAQVHAFCVRSGGTSRLASTPGFGTTVSMLLPAC
ncbi:MAG: hypothetical protein Q7T97_09980 [Burkholderiaceae bacterium]|nr:hypothetical protein [Burkholderiaceae bacterium]